MTQTAADTLVIIGPTASGKSTLAHALARRVEAADGGTSGSVEIISADSMQVYRGMDIGTAKPTRAEQQEVRYHLIDVADPSDNYTVSAFQLAAKEAIEDIRSRGNHPVLVGGTGLYVQAVVNDLVIPDQYPKVRAAIDADPNTVGLHARLAELDPVAAARMEPNNRRRVTRALEVTLGSGEPFSSFGPGIDAYPDVPFRQVGIRLPRPLIDERIDERYAQQMQDGFLEEVDTLRRRPGGLSRTARQALGYKELLEHLEARLSLAGAVDLAQIRTRKFARRQERWFRRDTRITWLDTDKNPMDLLDQLLEHFVLCSAATEPPTSQETYDAPH